MTAPKKAAAGDGGREQQHDDGAEGKDAAVAAVAGALSYSMTKSIPAAILAAGPAFAGAVIWINHLMGPE